MKPGGPSNLLVHCILSISCSVRALYRSWLLFVNGRVAAIALAYVDDYLRGVTIGVWNPSVVQLNQSLCANVSTAIINASSCRATAILRSLIFAPAPCTRQTKPLSENLVREDHRGSISCDRLYTQFTSSSVHSLTSSFPQISLQ